MPAFKETGHGQATPADLMREEPPPGVLTWLINILATCVVLLLFQKSLWLVVPVLLALVLYYCLRPLVQALVRAGLKHRTAVKVVAGILFLETVLAVVLLTSIASSHSAQWKSTAGNYVNAGLELVRNTEKSLGERFPILEPALTRSSPEKLGQFANEYLGVLLLQMVQWLPSLLLMPYLTYFMLQDANRFKKELIRSVPNA